MHRFSAAEGDCYHGSFHLSLLMPQIPKPICHKPKNKEEQTKNIIVVLTLKKHEDGAWITKLVNCLESILNLYNKQHDTIIEIRALETWMSQGWIISSPCFENISAIVNRVSDAASPPLFKATLAILQSAQSLGIPIVNGPKAYAMCGNKWCHHVLFSQAGIKSPSTLMFWSEEGNKNRIESIQEQIKLMNLGDGCTLLAKPNAGGFGAGIMPLTKPSEDIPSFEDCITILQKYEQPRDNKLYRVWFLDNKIQCAVERDVQDDESQFTTGCSGSCSIQRPKAWTVPADVANEIEQQLLPLLTDAHCGSVEFLYTQEGTRLYFDLNLLSTLPINARNDDVWDSEYDPWMEQARVVWNICK